jgi:hypothetical protein
MKDLRTPQQLAEDEGIPLRQIYELTRKGQIATIRRGDKKASHILIATADFEAWKQRKRRPAKDETATPSPRSSVRDLPGADRYLN